MHEFIVYDKKKFAGRKVGFIQDIDMNIEMHKKDE